MRPTLLVLVGVAVVVALALPRTAEIRARAEAGLAAGMPAREAELAKGFVLGEDEGVDARTEEDFRRAGLSHLLAVSGQNVTLLALLALPFLAALGIPLRQRLLWVLALIAVYVPLTGAGPTIQRAAVMGALGIVATLAGRRASRFYALVFAAGLTLAIDPTIAGDVGWQLSFAAVLGILVWARPLAAGLSRWLGGGGWRRALAEGVAVTVAATLATAPLIAFHFERISTTTLVANVLALPAVAPAMWLGMASAGAAQVPGFPSELLNVPNAVLLAYIAQVAAWCAAPDWAEVEVHLSGLALAVTYTALAAAALTWRAAAVLRRPRLARVRTRWRYSPPSADSWLPAGAIGVGLAFVVGLALAWPDGGAEAGAPASGLRITFFDVGQGDAILMQPARAPAVLVDGGPPGAGLARELEEAGVTQLGAVIATHDQSDHVGGLEELLGSVPIAHLLYGRLGRDLKREARAAAIPTQQVFQGTSIRSGHLRLEFLWPAAELLAEPGPGADPNQLALVAVARWGRFTMLLSADAEAEAVPLDPGHVDLLKVAHHGSEDAGLVGLLDRTRPALAVISVGEDNPYGHPTAVTLATLAAHGVQTLRTDRDGEVVIDVSTRKFAISGG